MARVRVPRKKYGDEIVEYYPNLRLDTRSGIYYWDEMINGEHHRKSTGQKTIKKALTVIKQFRASATDSATNHRITLSELFNNFLEIQKGKSKRTATIADQGNRRLRRYIDNPKNKCVYLDQFIAAPENHWKRYADYAYSENMKNLGRQGDLTHDRKFLQAVLNRAFKNNLIKRKFESSDFPLRHYETDSGRALTDDEIKILLDTSLNEMDCDWLYLMIIIGATTGMRHLEIRSLRIEEIDFKGGVFKLDQKKIKTRTKRKLNPFIPSDTVEMLKRFSEKSRKAGGEFIFPGQDREGNFHYDRHRVDIYRQWKRLKSLSGIECKFKDLRATCITNMIKERIPPTTIAAYLGNSVEEIMKAYDKVHTDLREEVRTLFDGRFYIGE